jgi:hypothetical protein
MAKGLEPVEGYNMLIFEHEDGTVTFTGSFNASEWDRYTAAHPKREVSEAVVVPDPSDAGSTTDADLVDQPAGNASTEDWRAYALTQGATEDEVADLSRKELRDKYGTEES